MKYAIRIAGKDVWIHDPASPLTVEKAIEIAKSSPHETIVYKDDQPFMRFRPKVGVSAIAHERASH